MASTSLHTSGNTCHTSPVVSISVAADMLGVSPATARRMIAGGQIESATTLGGHRRVSVASINNWLGFDDGGDNEQERVGEIAIYCRVSSLSQDRQGSLDRQLERLLSEVAEREGIERGEIQVYKDVASSFGNREGLNNLVEAIIGGKVTRIYCEFQDRLSRVPALTRLIESLAGARGVEIIHLDKEEKDADSLQDAMKELLDYCTVVSNRISAAKSRKVTFKELEPQTVARIIELRETGHNVSEIYRLLESEGHKATTGMGKTSRVSMMKIRRVIESGGMVTATSPCGKRLASQMDGIQSTFEVWAESHLEIIPDGEYDLTTRVESKTIYKAYSVWAENTGRKAESYHGTCRLMPEAAKPRKWRSNTTTWYRGVRII